MSYSNVVKREIKRMYNRPLVWTISFVFPLFLCLLVCLIFSSATLKDLPIAVLDNDNSEISRTIVRYINTLPSCKAIYRVTSLYEGKKLLTQGKSYALFVIPKNFQRDMHRLKQPKLVFYYNSQKILIGGVISKDVNLMINSILIGLDAKVRNKKGLPLKESVNQANLIQVYDHIRSNPYFNYQYFLSLIAFGHILQIHILLTTLWALGTEFKLGTTKEWLKSADNSIITAILGKFTPYFCIFILLFFILFLTYFILLQVPYVGNIPLGIFATIEFIITCMFLSTIFISINGNFRYCLSNAAFFVGMGFAFAGVTYPTIAMPLPAKIYSAMFPLSYWIQIMIDQSLRKFPFIYDLKHIFALIILLSISLLTLPRIKKLAKDEKRWYQQ